MTYPIKLLQASSKTYTQGRAGKSIDYIVIHYTSSMASAKNNCLYFSGGNRNSSAHYFLDGSGTIWQSVLDRDTAWAGGNFDINQRSISIEVVSDGRDFSEAEIQELSFLVRKLMRKYNLQKHRVIRHYDVVSVATIGKTIDPYKHCPAPYINQAKWEMLRNRITSGEDLPYSQITEDGWLGHDSIRALQKIFGIYVNGIFWGQPSGWEPFHLRIPEGSISYQDNPELMSGSEVVMNMQRLAGYEQNGYLSKGFIKAWQGYVSDTIEQDGYLGEGTAKATQRWINHQLEKNQIKL